ncbi:SH3 domain-containing protein [Chloroflexota bacterium]
MKNKTIFIFTFLLFVCACSSPSAEELVPTYMAGTQNAEATKQAFVEQSIHATFTYQASLATPTPPATATPPATSTPTATMTPATIPMVEVIVGDTLIRKGPGEEYLISGQASAGQQFEVIGQSDDGEWIKVQISPSVEGWLQITAVELNVEIEELPVLERPPTPMPATVTFSIINRAARKAYLWILDLDGNLIKHLKVNPGKEASFQIDRGTYILFYGLGNKCGAGFYIDINSDFLWMPDDNFACGKFP